MGIMEELKNVRKRKNELERKGYVFDSFWDGNGYVYSCEIGNWKVSTRRWRDTVELASEHDEKGT